ncbi:potassium/proton antiporter [Anaerostipes sp.]|uniref:potassium/proton antiporter n=1 Tax=Anaerostipes sp. TaxID=1872530 RepID=UPI0025C67D4B|nr:potassium/proton antiporter [Anaerostipes sp.]MBS7009430.1 potassium/proton antiporter [Anaerostipes sp.]
MEFYLLLCAVVLLLCIFSNKISDKIGVPSLLIFMFLGMIFGSEGIFKIEFSDFRAAEHICTAALIFIMFYGGYSTNWEYAKPAVKRAVVLSTLGVVMTAAMVCGCCYFLLKLPLPESFLIGSVVSCTDAASVFSIFRSKNLNLEGNLAPLLEIESGSNDPFSYMLTVTALTVMKGGQIGFIWKMIVLQLAVGVGIGMVIGVLAPKVIRRFKFCTDGFDAVFVLAAALISYALAGILGGNGFLSVYLTGIIMGNAKTKNKANVVRFFDNITILAQIATFFLIGLLSYPSQMVSSLPETTVIILFLTLAARPVMIFILNGGYLKFSEKIFVSFAGLRGASSIVFAIFASAGGVPMQSNVFHIVFGLALISVAVQGTFLPEAARRLHLIDEKNDVLKTFNDYQEESAMTLMQMHISSGHHWENRRLKDVTLPEGSLAMVIRRGDEIIIPKGDTVIRSGDDIAVNVPSYEAANEIALKEISIDEEHPWRDRQIKDLDLKDHILIAMIRRKDEDIIPNGETRIHKEDVLVIYDE